MPICTTCTYKIPYLYTVYQSAHNLRLEQCPKCLNFADPYVEHDILTLLLDLILLKRGVFRHLLFNRGYGPRHVSKSSEPVEDSEELDERQQSHATEIIREKDRWKMIFRLGIILVFVDAFIRWSHIGLSSNIKDNISTLRTKEHIEPLLRIFAGCMIETIAFHIGVTLTSAMLLKVAGLWSTEGKTLNSESLSSGVREELRLSHVPLTLLYSSLTKLFLLLCLALWKPSSAPTRRHSLTSSEGGIMNSFLAHDATRKALEIFDDDKLDREWVVRNVLGGMAAGFGLRVVLDMQPVFTTVIIIIGWAVKTFVANLVSTWVSKGDATGDVFLAYSIP
ncbi:Arv1-domain-containing protein [Phellopilus nigrolimitatus]|nr:Arv1-domain-containing protein [Phellopilus nigrolimitatus]